MSSRATRTSTTLVAAATALLLAGVLALLQPTAAGADTAPPVPSPVSPVTVSADPLPTAQINGVVWSQTVVGDTVYAAGQFSRARPAGAPPGTSETVRNNLLAYDIRTGVLVPGFAPSLNAQALVVTPSPDGSRIYVGGDFTSVNGQPRNRVAAFDTATGALVPGFTPSASSQVNAIAATNDTVYLGGALTAIGGVARQRLAAVRASDGLLLPWAPVPGVGSTAGNSNGNTATSNVVLALVVTPGNQVVAAGRFDSLNGIKATGVGALDGTTGATRPFAINQLITNQGVNSAIWSLSTDGTNVYGSAYDYFGPGNLEGTFAVTAAGGAVISINECHGDTYSTFPLGGVLYVTGHPHVCSNIGGFPEQNPRVHKYGIAVSIAPRGTVGTATLKNRNFTGQPAAALLPWFPTFSSGTYTAAYQAGWSVSGNSQYVVYGGEFPRVNGVAQQGLVRFALPSIAPNRVGPAGSAALTPAITTPAAGTARLAWTSTSDQDNEFLTYRVYRDDDTVAPVYETVLASTWWRTPAMTFTDVGVAGGTHRYRVTATDPLGNRTVSDWASVTVTGGANVAPVAAFTATTSGLTASVDGSASADPDGTIAAHAWDFGDGTTGSGATTTHSYAAAGTYTVRLTVTDNRGLTGTTTQSVTVATTPPGPTVLAADTFARTVSGGLGTADVGGPWTVSAGGIRQSVAPGVATLALLAGGNLTGSFLGGVSQTGSDVLTSVALSAAPTGGGVSYYVTGRRVGVNLEYRARVRFTPTGAVFVGVTRLEGTASEVLIGEAQVPGLTYTPGTVLQVRVRTVGTAPTQLAVTAWPATSAEPTTPSVVRTDSTASLQAAGGFALSAYLSAAATAPVNVRVSAFRAVNAQ